MSKSYIIEWKSQVNGRAGRGTKRFEEREAKDLAEELNREYPAIHHEAVEIEDASTPASEPPFAAQPEAAPEVALSHRTDHALSVG